MLHRILLLKTLSTPGIWAKKMIYGHAELFEHWIHQAVKAIVFQRLDMSLPTTLPLSGTQQPHEPGHTFYLVSTRTRQIFFRPEGSYVLFALLQSYLPKNESPIALE